MTPGERKLMENIFGKDWDAEKDIDYLKKALDSESDTNLQKPLHDIIGLERERMEWSLKTFPEATAFSSLEKLEDEIEEVRIDLAFTPVNPNDLTEEYADCLMCLFDSAGRAGITPEQIFEAFSVKLRKNKARTWVKNPNNTYSHVK